MAVYTKLNSEEISGFLEKYSIGKLVSFKEIIDGIDNSNFIIESESGKYILTIFESRIQKEDLPFFMNFKLHLASKGISCPKPVVSNSGLSIESLKGRSASIVTFLSGATLKPKDDGYYDNITAKHCFEIGKITALMHIAAVDFKGFRKNDLGRDGWRKLFNKIADQIENYQTGLKEEISDYIDFLEKNWQENLPNGVIHSDLFPDNVFFDGDGNLSGVIDFYFSANDLFIYDLTVVINAWCFDENNQFSQEKFDNLILGYESVRKISTNERDFLKTALIAAALRFLLTRLHDLFHTPKDSIVKVKNPTEYLEKIRFFVSQNTVV